MARLTKTMMMDPPPFDMPTPPNGQVGTPYSFQCAPTGGTPPYVFSGTLQAGLSMNTGGLISGTPTAAGQCSITVTDANG